MCHKIKVILDMIHDPWFWIFSATALVCWIIYKTEGRWKW